MASLSCEHLVERLVRDTKAAASLEDAGQLRRCALTSLLAMTHHKHQLRCSLAVV